MHISQTWNKPLLLESIFIHRKVIDSMSYTVYFYPKTNCQKICNWFLNKLLIFVCWFITYKENFFGSFHKLKSVYHFSVTLNIILCSSLFFQKFRFSCSIPFSKIVSKTLIFETPVTIYKKVQLFLNIYLEWNSKCSCASSLNICVSNVQMPELSSICIRRSPSSCFCLRGFTWNWSTLGFFNRRSLLRYYFSFGSS